MPKRVDHQQRRQQIADALLRVAATRGLHATGMREVAAEAGVSLRLIQYYFGTKEELMLFATQQLAARFGERGMARISRLKETGSPVRPRDVIAAILAEAVPADDEMRTFYVIYTAYLALSLTDQALALAPLVKNSGAVTGVIAAQLRAAQADGDTPARMDPDLEALSLIAMSAGLATSVLAGQSSAGQAQAVIDYHLNRLFPASGPALRASTTCRPPGSAQARKRRRHPEAEVFPTAPPCGPHDEGPSRTDRSRATHTELYDLHALVPADRLSFRTRNRSRRSGSQSTHHVLLRRGPHELLRLFSVGSCPDQRRPLAGSASAWPG